MRGDGKERIVTYYTSLRVTVAFIAEGTLKEEVIEIQNEALSVKFAELGGARPENDALKARIADRLNALITRLGWTRDERQTNEWSGFLNEYGQPVPTYVAIMNWGLANGFRCVDPMDMEEGYERADGVNLIDAYITATGMRISNPS